MSRKRNEWSVIIFITAAAAVLGYFSKDLQYLYLCGFDKSCHLWGQRSSMFINGFFLWFLLISLYISFRKSKTPKEKKETKIFRWLLPLSLVFIIGGIYLFWFSYTKTDTRGITFQDSINSVPKTFIKWDDIQATGIQFVTTRSKYRTYPCAGIKHILLLKDNSIVRLSYSLDFDPNLESYIYQAHNIPIANSLVPCDQKI